jgi:hypothetical protein
VAGPPGFSSDVLGGGLFHRQADEMRAQLAFLDPQARA